MGQEITIPLLGISTWVSNSANENEIIEAVNEASIAFCIASTKYGMGIENELIAVEKDKNKKEKRNMKTIINIKNKRKR